MANKGFWVEMNGKKVHIQGNPNMSDDELALIIKMVDELTKVKVTEEEPSEIVDYGFECSMCGKPMSYRYCGMCTHCEQVWNG